MDLLVVAEALIVEEEDAEEDFIIVEEDQEEAAADAFIVQMALIISVLDHSNAQEIDFKQKELPMTHNKQPCSPWCRC
jgi:hypothetical protein